MRSRTSRGVPEWSGGEDLYMGIRHTVTGNIRGYTGIVPGPPEGFRGSTERVHLPRRALWAVGGREPALSGLAHPPWASPHAPRVETLGVGAPPRLGGQATPLGRRPPRRLDLLGPAPPGCLYIVGGERAAAPQPLAPLPPIASPTPPAGSRRSPAAFPVASTTTPSCCWISVNLSSPLAGPRKRRRRCTVRVLNAEVPSVRRWDHR